MMADDVTMVEEAGGGGGRVAVIRSLIPLLIMKITPTEANDTPIEPTCQLSLQQYQIPNIQYQTSTKPVLDHRQAPPIRLI